ncbi:universal stress protein [Pseudomonas sp. Pseusp122]|uniref:universal stress protein n=1 Tax=unclassified Pseudomonas TaxID=196821 RepID=UPI0039A53F45
MIQPMRLMLITPHQAVHSPAIDYAGALAKNLGASLHLVAFVHDQMVDWLGHRHPCTRDKARQGMIDTHRFWLNTETVLLREQGVDAHYDVVWADSLVKDMIAYAKKVNAALIIKDFHDDAHLKRLVFSCMDWDLLCASPVSVLYVDRSSGATCRRFLVAVDIELEAEGMQQENDQILTEAHHMASLNEASLDMISIYDSGMAKRVPLISSAEPANYAARKEVFEALATQYNIDPQHRHFLVGTPVTVIRGLLQRNPYELLIIGSANHHLLQTQVGYTTEGILESPGCNVLAVKLPPFVRPSSASA